MSSGPSLSLRLYRWFGRFLSSRATAYGLAILAIVAGALTYAAITGLLPSRFSSRHATRVMLAIDLAILLALASVVVGRLTRSFVERRRGVAGARLHLRLVLLFGLFAVAPTFVVAMVSGYWLSVSLREFVSAPLSQGLESAHAMVDAMRTGVLSDVDEISKALQAEGIDTLADGEKAKALLGQAAQGRNLLEVSIIDSDRKIVASSVAYGRGPAAGMIPPPETFAKAAAEARPVFAIAPTGVYIILQLFTDGNLFLVTVPAVDPVLWQHSDRIELARTFYTNELDTNFDRNQFKIFGIYALIALLMLLSAVWMAVTFASRLTGPIASLMSAAESVRRGNLSARVTETPTDDELGRLVRAFNRMAAQIDEQRRELIDTNRQLDERRQLTEAILAGVSAGVLSVDMNNRVERANRSAVELLGKVAEDIEGHAAADILPELDSMLEQVRARPDRLLQAQVEILRAGQMRSLHVRIAAEQSGSESRGFVVTFDDVSDLMSAQRMAAWADVARRIAHEIKNPLTPIQLSAERLKRRYLRQIAEDPETFTTCTDTIIRQVGDIGRMVDEFSSFARMPRAILAEEDLKEICQQALFLQRNAQPQMLFEASLPEASLSWRVDRRQIGQALTNLLKNAGEAIEGRDPPKDGGKLPPGQIALALREDARSVRIVIEDNGRGLPRNERARLTEPYVTTRTKGTGLGLAIVKKIMEEHGGLLILEDREGGGARISLVFQRPERKAAPGTRDVAAAVSPAAGD
ncbi:PAS domain-containing sensor histidine kinase [Vineibacter terrae]|uniref:histidine kinase n=1 Tax=Vineibacter terrae TaxID=2586908 RepID=A0A5C8PFB7_9HYPH|nr:PAS domain-containing sensor histidine kinase [Vineibacter terrae]TXL72202.1 PAS domain-containing sensor histidine kinase [Vineibacter terrae]